MIKSLGTIFIVLLLGNCSPSVYGRTVTPQERLLDTLFLAIDGGSVNNVVSLLNKGAPINDYLETYRGEWISPPFGDTPLLYSITALNKERHPDYSPTWLIKKTYRFITGSKVDEKPWLQTVKLLVDKGADVNKPAQKGMKDTPLLRALRMELEDIANYLLDHGAEVNVHDAAYFTPLMYAQSYNMVKRLVDQGAEVNAVSSAGMTVLEYALYNKLPANAIKLLKDHGARS